MAFRVDKYVWSVRLAKTRSQASELISKGKIKLNNVQVKSSREPKVGDSIQISKNTAVYSYKIIQLLDKRIGAKLVEEYIIDITPEEEKEKYPIPKQPGKFYEYRMDMETLQHFEERDFIDALEYVGLIGK